MKGNNADLFASEIYVAWNNIARNIYDSFHWYLSRNHMPWFWLSSV